MSFIVLKIYKKSLMSQGRNKNTSKHYVPELLWAQAIIHSQSCWVWIGRNFQTHIICQLSLMSAFLKEVGHIHHRKKPFPLIRLCNLASSNFSQLVCYHWRQRNTKIHRNSFCQPAEAMTEQRESLSVCLNSHTSVLTFAILSA